MDKKWNKTWFVVEGTEYQPLDERTLKGVPYPGELLHFSDPDKPIYGCWMVQAVTHYAPGAHPNNIDFLVLIERKEAREIE